MVCSPPFAPRTLQQLLRFELSKGQSPLVKKELFWAINAAWPPELRVWEAHVGEGCLEGRSKPGALDKRSRRSQKQKKALSQNH
eukprot:1145295-Pelagomonas_calceolata.AAC.1